MTNHIGSLSNQTIFITGASSGIGMACAHYFAKEGARLLLCARRLPILEQLASELKAVYGTESHVFQLNVTDNVEVETTLNKLPKDWQQIDVLINNAGLAAGLDPIQDGKVDDWNAMLDTNVKGLLFVTKYIVDGMLKRNHGHIINIGSIAGHTVYPKGVVYCASKHAVKAISEGLRMDLFGSKIRVTSIDPGAVETNFSNVRFKGDESRASQVYKGMTPLSANDIADLVLYCAKSPPHVNISDVIIMPTDQASATMVHRIDN